jgi:hypothetical protein
MRLKSTKVSDLKLIKAKIYRDSKKKKEKKNFINKGGRGLPLNLSMNINKFKKIIKSS